MQKKLEKEMAESKYRSLQLKDKQDEVQQLMKQVKQRDSEVWIY